MFSVVVPVFNVESYLYEALRSIAEQDFSDFEAVIIDDGSTDGSRLIYEEFCRSDARFRSIFQENAGLGSARNAGLRAARGEYIVFFDSDDLLTPYTLSTINNTLENNKAADVVLFSGTAFGDASHKFNYVRNNTDTLMTGPAFLSSSIIDGSFTPSACLYACRRELLVGNSFPTDILHEDIPFYIQLLLREDITCLAIGDQLFKRRVRAGSIMTSSSNFRHYIGYSRALRYIINIDSSRESREAHKMATQLITRSVARSVCALPPSKLVANWIRELSLLIQPRYIRRASLKAALFLLFPFLTIRTKR